MKGKYDRYREHIGSWVEEPAVEAVHCSSFSCDRPTELDLDKEN